MPEHLLPLFDGDAAAHNGVPRIQPTARNQLAPGCYGVWSSPAEQMRHQPAIPICGLEEMSPLAKRSCMIQLSNQFSIRRATG